MHTPADAPPQTRWDCPPRSPDAENALSTALGLPALACAALVSRGFTSPDEAEKFLEPDLKDLHDPLLLPDCDTAVSAIMSAKENAEKIFIHGDYDVDGVSSAAIWARALRRLGFDVTAHVPHRMKEGYGIHESAVRAAHEARAALFLTCDCGSSAIEAVKMAREVGMRVVITDHHEVGPALPDAQAVVNPIRADSRYPYPYLSGSGVAFKVAQAVAQACGASASGFQRAFLDLVCLGTIADVVPLTGENRVLARHGLQHLAETKKEGLRALMEAASIDPTDGVSARDVAWRLAPRLNAAGRIDDAAHALRLLLTEDPDEARQQAELLNRHNDERKSEQKRILSEAEETVVSKGLHRRALMLLYSDDWHPGVIGIVAGRLAEKYNRPTLVASVDAESGTARGSARSIPAFNLHQALAANRDLFLSCGGHARAAGFTIENSRLDEAAERLNRYAAESLTPEDLIPRYRADAEVQLAELTDPAIEALERMRPFGEGNPEPAFILRDAEFSWIKPTSNPQHVRFGLVGPALLSGIAFGMGDRFTGLQPGDRADLLVRPQIDTWNGRRRPRLTLVDFRRSGDGR